MKTFAGKLAVVTGAGSGMGRELVRQLVSAGADVAMCDVSEENMIETVALATADSPSVKLSTHLCDVADEAQVLAFRDAVQSAHETDHIDALFNNAGIGGGGSFVADERESWERTYNICWGGVYLCTRAFMDLLVRSEDGALINTSSINGFWASVGADRPHTSYSAAKFAVKGFTEALIADFRVNAPHLSAHVVMPGHIGTSIALNSASVHGVNVVDLRKRLAMQDIPTDHLSDSDLEALVADLGASFRDDAPTTSAQAATVILDAVIAGEWRILIGDDAYFVDELVRQDPGSAYEPDFIERLTGAGHFLGLIQ